MATRSNSPQRLQTSAVGKSSRLAMSKNSESDIQLPDFQNDHSSLGPPLEGPSGALNSPTPPQAMNHSHSNLNPISPQPKPSFLRIIFFQDGPQSADASSVDRLSKIFFGFWVPVFTALFMVIATSIGITEITKHNKTVHVKCPPARGNQDMYGIGIRIATYAQFCFTPIMEYVAPQHTISLALTNMFFLMAFVIGQLKLFQNGELQSGPLDAFIINALGSGLATNALLGEALCRSGYLITRILQLIFPTIWTIFQIVALWTNPTIFQEGPCSYYVSMLGLKIIKIPSTPALGPSASIETFSKFIIVIEIIIWMYMIGIWFFKMVFLISIIVNGDEDVLDNIKERTAFRKRGLLQDLFLVFRIDEVDKIICGEPTITCTDNTNSVITQHSEYVSLTTSGGESPKQTLPSSEPTSTNPEGLQSPLAVITSNSVEGTSSESAQEGMSQSNNELARQRFLNFLLHQYGLPQKYKNCEKPSLPNAWAFTLRNLPWKLTWTSYEPTGSLQDYKMLLSLGPTLCAFRIWFLWYTVMVIESAIGMADLDGINRFQAPGQLVAMVAGLGACFVSIIEFARQRRAEKLAKLMNGDVRCVDEQV